MNDLPNGAPQGPVSFVTATLIGRLDDEPINWIFPVVQGTTRDLVQAEIRTRCTGNYARLMHDPGTQINYPHGPWNGPITADNPPIGLRPPVPAGGAPPAQPELPPQPQQSPPRPQQPQTPYRAQDGRVVDLGPLPEANPRQSSEQTALSDLEDTLMRWRQRHGITSAEFFAYTLRIVGFYAGQLVSRERNPRR